MSAASVRADDVAWRSTGWRRNSGRGKRKRKPPLVVWRICVLHSIPCRGSHPPCGSPGRLLIVLIIAGLTGTPWRHVLPAAFALIQPQSHICRKVVSVNWVTRCIYELPSGFDGGRGSTPGCLESFSHQMTLLGKKKIPNSFHSVPVFIINISMISFWLKYI